MPDSDEIKIASIDIDNKKVSDVLLANCRDSIFDSFWKTAVGDHDPVLVQVDRERMAPPSESDEEIVLVQDILSSCLVKEMHVTMAHRSRMSQQELRDKFGPIVGSSIAVTATALLWSNRVAALAVELPDTTIRRKDGSEQSLPACQNAFPHITVWFAKGAAEAKESNDLPWLVDIGEAIRVDLEEPVTLRGSGSFWMEDKED